MTTKPTQPNQPNPLLDFSALPLFDQIQPEHVKPAIDALLDQTSALVEKLAAATLPPTFDNFARPLARGLEFLTRAWGIVGHLHSVNDTPPWREAYNALLPEVSRFYAELGQNEALFERYKAILHSPDFAQLTPAQARIIEQEIRGFRLSGAELVGKEKERFKAIQEELASLSAKFSENLLDATNAFSEHITDAALLTGLPADVIEAAKSAAKKDNLSGWLFTLQAPSYHPILQYAENRALRARFYRANATRAAEFHDGTSQSDWNNTPVIQRLLALREEEATLLGYANFAELSLVPKMAESPAQVLGFLRELACKAKPFAHKDYAELTEFAQTQLGIDNVEPWDIAFVSEKLLEARYAFSAQEVKQYFTEPKVLDGLFSVIERLFHVHVKPDRAPTWHEDVRFYRIENPAGELIGQFYMDLYARETKRGGAWMDEARAREKIDAKIQTPIAYLNCNFSAPIGEKDGKPKPATLTHDDVITLFHETGHGLHHLLTRVDELGVSGIRGVEWDAVELPSQFMENYAWEWDVVQGMSCHSDTGTPLPKALFDKMLAAKNFQSGLMMVRQLEFSLFDMRLHAELAPDVMALLNEVRQEVAVIPVPPWNRFPNSFSHIFGGGYAAGYFSYKWAEVLSADAYAAFEEAANPFDPATGKRYLVEILSMGGARSAMESFKAFRGREPNVDALLRHNGMV